MPTPQRPDSTKPTALTPTGYLMIAAIGVVACLPLYLYGLPLLLDLNHHYRTALGFYESIVNGNYYPSWHPGTNGGYGDPSVRFYPPALYFLLCLFRLITPDWFYASLLTVTSLTIAGTFGMYLWARSFTSHYYALAAGLLFVLSPFHANELYQSGMYGQYAAASVLPFVFAYVDRIILQRRTSDVALLGVSYGLLVLCNLPVAVLGSIAVAIYTLVRLAASFDLKVAYRLLIGGSLGVALSCFYWLPVLRELKWKSPSGIDQGAWFDYRNNFLFEASPSVMSDFLLPLLALATFTMGAPALVLLFKKNRRAIAPATIAVVGFFMSTALSKPIWDQLPILQETQFPWRWMTITSACISLLVALSLSEMYSMWRGRRRALSIGFTGLVLFALSFTIFQLMRGAILSDRVSFNQKVEGLKGTNTNQDFLPVWVKEKPREMESKVEAANRAVTVLNWSAERRVFSIEPGPATDVRLKTYYYPHWRAFADAQPLITAPAADGAMMIRVPSEKTMVEVTFKEPLSSYIAGTLSIVALIVIFSLLVLGRHRVRSSVLGWSSQPQRV
ncbi:MAG TPA: 6-pyruvoyl-tetrahydropterin synthase-related protein [Pyrinomonadaceae bacterium]